MRFVIVLVGLSILAGLTVVSVGIGDRGDFGAKPGFGGKVVELPLDKLPRFKQPQPMPPKQQPPDRPGGSWHWHPHHSWVWFPRAQAPRAVVLEPTYRLPPRVTYFERPGVNYVVCPHCGQTILLN